MSARLTYADKAAAVIDKLTDCSAYCLIDPVFSAALGSICIADIDHNVKILKKRRICLDVLKADKGNIKRSAA